MKQLLIALISFISITQATVVDSILNSLTLEEKIGQMIIVYHAPLSFLEEHNIGGTLVMRNMISDEVSFISSLETIQNEMPIPLLVSIDQEGGNVNRLSQKANWRNAPSAETMSEWSYTQSYEYHAKVAQKLEELGINLNLAPVLDPQLNSDNLPTYMKNENRAFSADGDSALLGFINAFTDNNVGTTAKHFPGYDALVNSDHHIAISHADSTQIEEYLLPFQNYRNDYQAIMMSSILYTEISDLPAVFSSTMIDLARSVDSSAVIMTDDLWGAALRSYVYDGPNMETRVYPDSSFTQVVELSFLAGNDMLMITYPQKVPLMIQSISNLAENSPELLTQIDRSVQRILSLKQDLGLIPQN